MNNETYQEIIVQCLKRFGIKKRRQTFAAEAQHWATAHGGKSGRIARQFANDLAGRLFLTQHQKKSGQQRRFRLYKQAFYCII
jgi:predicted AAA+ superfamily ATPase